MECSPKSDAIAFSDRWFLVRVNYVRITNGATYGGTWGTNRCHGLRRPLAAAPAEGVSAVTAMTHPCAPPTRLRRTVLRAATTLGLTAGAWLAISLASSDARAQGPLDGITDVVHEVSSTAGDLTGAVAATARPVVDNASGVVEPVIAIAAPVADIAADVAAPTVQYVAENAAPTVEFATDAAAPAFEAVGDVAAPVTEELAEITEPVLDAAAPVLDGVGDIVTPVIEVATPVVAPVVDAVSPVVDAVSPVVDVVSPVIDVTSPIVDAAAPITAPPGSDAAGVLPTADPLASVLEPAGASSPAADLSAAQPISSVFDGAAAPVGPTTLPAGTAGSNSSTPTTFAARFAFTDAKSAGTSNSEALLVRPVAAVGVNSALPSTLPTPSPQPMPVPGGVPGCPGTAGGSGGLTGSLQIQALTPAHSAGTAILVGSADRDDLADLLTRADEPGASPD